MRTWLSAACILTALLYTGAARAQSAADRAAAEDLFRQGRALMKSGNYAEACPKLEASNRMDPAFGTLVNLGDCYEKLGKPASAWASYTEAQGIARKEGQSDRIGMAAKRIEAIEPRLSRLKITLGAGANVPGVAITRDGTAIDRAMVGSATPLDPGEYTIAATAPGYKAWEGKVKLTEGQTSSIEVGPLEKKSPEELQQEANQNKQVIIGPPPPPPDPGKTRRLLGLGLGIGGGVALAVGGYFGINAFSKWSSAQDMCKGPGGTCTAEGVDLGNQAGSSATMANIFIGGGLALIATGIVLYVTAPSAGAEEQEATDTTWHWSPGLGGNPFGLTVQSRF